MGAQSKQVVRLFCYRYRFETTKTQLFFTSLTTFFETQRPVIDLQKANFGLKNAPKVYKMTFLA
jgi:hypothetical protein